jgi:hypothetical protein
VILQLYDYTYKFGIKEIEKGHMEFFFINISIGESEINLTFT